MASRDTAGRAPSGSGLASFVGGLGDRRLLVAVGVILAVALLAVVAWPRQPHRTSTVTPHGLPAATSASSVSGVAVTEGGPLTFPARSDVRPYRSGPLVVIGTTAGGAHVVRRLSTDRDGRFALNLAPGVYTITTIMFGSLPFARQPHAHVTVRRGHPLRVRLKGYVN
jgi:hypothetical protein